MGDPVGDSDDEGVGSGEGLGLVGSGDGDGDGRGEGVGVGGDGVGDFAPFGLMLYPANVSRPRRKTVASGLPA